MRRRPASASKAQSCSPSKKFDTTRIYFGEDADPKAEAQTAREALVDAQKEAYNKVTTRIDRK
jgi:hypothetical protein